MTGKLKTKGNMMFATKLDGVLKASPLRSCCPRQRSLSTDYLFCTGGQDKGQALDAPSAVSIRRILFSISLLSFTRREN